MVASSDIARVPGSVDRRRKARRAVSGFVHGPLVYAAAMIDRPSGRPAVSPSYAELHCHSAFSFLDGATLPEDLAAAAQSLSYRALALTDHNGLYGAMTFAQAAKPLGLQAITGAEVACCRGRWRPKGAPRPGHSPSAVKGCSARNDSLSSCSGTRCGETSRSP